MSDTPPENAAKGGRFGYRSGGPDEVDQHLMAQISRDYLPPKPPSVGAGYVRRTGTTSPEVTEDFRVVCRHCKAELPALGDHTCPCPFSDEECPDHG